MPLLGPKASGPVIRPIRYRIKPEVRPYGGRILYPEVEEADRVGGRIAGATARRWYDRTELERLR